MFIASVRPSVRPSVCLSACPSVRLSVCPSVRPSVCLSVWNQNLVVWKQNLTTMQGPRSGREGGPRSGPEKLSSAPRSTSSIWTAFNGKLFSRIRNYNLQNKLQSVKKTIICGGNRIKSIILEIPWDQIIKTKRISWCSCCSVKRKVLDLSLQFIPTDIVQKKSLSLNVHTIPILLIFFVIVIVAAMQLIYEG